jgi:hypothetical protein
MVGNCFQRFRAQDKTKPPTRMRAVGGSLGIEVYLGFALGSENSNNVVLISER